MTERQIQRLVVQFFRRAGWTVYVTSSNKKSRIAVGFPDLYVVADREAFWFETKTPTGSQTAAQRAFEETVLKVGVRYVVGGLREAEAMVRYLHTSPSLLGSLRVGVAP